MVWRKFVLLFLLIAFTHSSSAIVRSMMMSSMIDMEFRCPDTNCYPLARMLVSRLLYCPTACLTQERCRTINFYQSTNLCELFAEAPDNNDAILANIGTVLMTIIDGTRVPFG